MSPTLQTEPPVDAASRAVRAFEDFYRGISAPEADPSTTLEQLREGVEHWGDVGRDPDGVDYRHDTAGGVPGLWALPLGAASDPVLVCSHGGGAEPVSNADQLLLAAADEFVAHGGITDAIWERLRGRFSDDALLHLHTASYPLERAGPTRLRAAAQRSVTRDGSEPSR